MKQAGRQYQRSLTAAGFILLHDIAGLLVPQSMISE
jgi:hypothetical protein